MLKKDQFLEKVYDKYLSSDYSYGVSNLNPKREISVKTIEETRDDEDKILQAIKARFEAIKNDVDVIASIPRTDDPDDFETPSAGAGNSTGTPASTSLLGENGGKIFIPGFDPDDPDALVKEIETYIIGLIPYLSRSGDTIQPTIENGEDNVNQKDKSKIDDIGTVFLFQLDCEGLSYEELISESLSDQTDLDMDSSMANATNADIAANVNGNANASGNEDDGNGDYTNSDSSVAGIEGNQRAADEKVQALYECAMLELSWLKVILTILKVLKQLKKCLLLVLSIVVPLVKIVARAASCWVDPPAAAEAVQLVLEKVAALMFKLLGKLLQTLWDMLNLDCLSNQTQSLLDQIKQALADIQGIANTGTAMSFAVKNSAEDISNSVKVIKQAKDNFNDTMSEYPDKLKEQMSKVFSSVDSIFANKDTWLNILPDGAKSLTNEISALVNNGAAAQVQDMADAFQSSVKAAEAAAKAVSKIFSKEKDNLSKSTQDAEGAGATITGVKE